MGELLLIAARDPATRDAVAGLCRAGGHEVLSAASRPALEEHLRRTRPHAVLAEDVLLEGSAGFRAADPPLVLLTAQAEGAPAFGGAVDVLVLPVTGPQLALALARVRRLLRLREERDELRAGPTHGAREVLEGSSAAAVRLRERVQRVASTPQSTVLVTGEVGCEKELVGRAVHALSTHAAGPFRVHACGSEEPARFRALLTGGEQGEGLLARAAGGSLFLGEVSALAPESQAFLAVLLRDRTFFPGGGGKERPLDVRILASTRTDLEARTEQGLFSGDLYYRLNVLTIPVPPLRRRREDLPELARHILRRLPLTAPGGLPTLSAAARDRLAAHDWPGNLRELRATLVRAALHARGEEIQPGHLGLETSPAGDDGAPSALPLGDRSLRTMEESLIRRVLEEEGGNRSRAARVLGINRSTLYNKLRQYGL